MSKKQYTAIIIFNNGEYARKWRKISNLASLEASCVKLGADYINLYDKETKQYVRRIYIKKGV